jgi:GATA-binding protein
MQHHRTHVCSHRLSSLSNSAAPQYIYSANSPSFTAVISSGPSTLFPSPRPFRMASRIDLIKVFPSEYHVGLPDLPTAHKDTFCFGSASDCEGKEGAAFADRTLIIQPEFAQSLTEDPSLKIGPRGGLQWDTSWSGQCNTQAVWYPDGPLKKQATIRGTTTDISFLTSRRR